MKPTLSTALATWMLDHLTLGARNESLSGDLLEELHSGRSTAWYWRQTLASIAITLSTRTRAYTHASAQTDRSPRHSRRRHARTGSRRGRPTATAHDHHAWARRPRQF